MQGKVIQGFSFGYNLDGQVEDCMKVQNVDCNKFLWLFKDLITINVVWGGYRSGQFDKNSIVKTTTKFYFVEENFQALKYLKQIYRIISIQLTQA